MDEVFILLLFLANVLVNFMVDFPEAFPDVLDHKFVLLSEFLIDGESALNFFNFLALILLFDLFVVLGGLFD